MERAQAIAGGVFDLNSAHYARPWPDVTRLAIDLFAPHQRSIEGTAKGKHLVLTSNAPPFRVILNASFTPVTINRVELAPWALVFTRDGAVVAGIDFMAGPDGELACIVPKGLSAVHATEKGREIEDQIIEALKAEVAKRAA